MSNNTQWILQLLDEAFDKPAWHGPNLRGALRRVSCDEAVWRLHPKRRNIWEIAVHCAYWKYAVRRRFTQEKRGSFPIKGSNWFARDGSDGPDGWKREVKLLVQMHAALHATVRDLPAQALSSIPKGCKVVGAEVLRGIALHDVYHAGQIQLLKRLMK